MEKLSTATGLIISQKKEWGEILTDFETKNRYAVLDLSGKEMYIAAEQGGSTLARLFLKALRPFEIGVSSLDGTLVLRAVRPFRFFFHELKVYDAKGRLLGTIKKKFSLLRRIYSISDSSGREKYQLYGPILHPWTFEIRNGSRVFGKITKKWSGLLKEGFTDADNFGVTFPGEWSIEQKAVFLGTIFLIDFVHFEDKGKN